MPKQIFRVNRDIESLETIITETTVTESTQTTDDLPARVRALETFALSLSQRIAAFEPSCAYAEFFWQLNKKQIDFELDEFRMMLMRSGYQPDLRKHAFRADIEQWEVRDNGYERGGKPCTLEFAVEAGKTILLSSEVLWENMTIVPAFAVVYRVANDLLVMCTQVHA
jgi:hypothetical protein